MKRSILVYASTSEEVEFEAQRCKESYNISHIEATHTYPLINYDVCIAFIRYSPRRCLAENKAIIMKLAKKCEHMILVVNLLRTDATISCDPLIINEFHQDIPHNIKNKIVLFSWHMGPSKLQVKAVGDLIKTYE